MSKWEKVKLVDIAFINMGQSPSSDTYNTIGDGIPFYQGNADFGELYPNARVYCSSPLRIANTNDILLSVRAPIGEINIAKENCCIGRGLCSLTVRSNCYLKYLFYILIKEKSELNRMGTGSTFKAISKQKLMNLSILLPPIDVQRKIAETLDIVSELLKYRKRYYNELDYLVKSRFVEMFGDPVVNTKGWGIKTVIDECECMVPGRDKPKHFTGDIPWITIDDLVVNGITVNSKKGLGLTQEEIAEVKRKIVPVGSVVMSCVGNLGICSIAGKELIINQQLHSFQCGRNVNKYFLMHYLGYRTDYMNKHASSTTVLYMNKGVCNSIPLILPPLSLQNQFADFVQQVDKQKFEVQKAITKTEELLDSLMQKYFD